MSVVLSFSVFTPPSTIAVHTFTFFLFSAPQHRGVREGGREGEGEGEGEAERDGEGLRACENKREKEREETVPNCVHMSTGIWNCISNYALASVCKCICTHIHMYSYLHTLRTPWL